MPTDWKMMEMEMGKREEMGLVLLPSDPSANDVEAPLTSTN